VESRPVELRLGLADIDSYPGSAPTGSHKEWNMAMDGPLAAVRPSANKRVRVHLHIAVALAALVIACVPGSARAASMPPQGVYEYCAPASSPDGCVGRLRQIAAGGFGVVLNYAVFDADSAQIRRYMSTAESLGVKLIWPMKDTAWWGPGSLARAYPRLARSCGCDSDDAFLRYVVGLVTGSPATWGYYVADEQSPADASRVAAFSRRLRALDPHHPRLAIAAGDDTVAQLLAPFAPAADVLGADSYPIGTGQPLDRVGFVARAVRSVALVEHRRSAIVLQAFDWSSYPDAGPWPAPRWPTAGEMRQMRDLAIRAADPSLILWYSYFNIRQAPDPDARWRGLVWAAYGR
jgi:hypothetical protein